VTGPELYAVIYHPSYEWYQQLNEMMIRPPGQAAMPYSGYPVVSKSGLTLAGAEAFVAANSGINPEFYRIVPAGAL
jgi:hypothetical protein